MLYLYGEWWNSNILFSLAFIFALVGVTALAWWVLRGDAINRRRPPSDPDREEAAPAVPLTKQGR